MPDEQHRFTSSHNATRQFCGQAGRELPGAAIEQQGFRCVALRRHPLRPREVQHRSRTRFERTVAAPLARHHIRPQGGDGRARVAFQPGGNGHRIQRAGLGMGPRRCRINREGQGLDLQPGRHQVVALSMRHIKIGLAQPQIGAVVGRGGPGMVVAAELTVVEKGVLASHGHGEGGDVEGLRVLQGLGLGEAGQLAA